MAKPTSAILAVSAAAMLLAGCSDVQESLGIARNVPDEFAVVPRAPLSVPPGVSLPQPGTTEPAGGVVTAPERGAAAVLGGDTTGGGVTSGQAALLASAGANRADPNIRRVVDQETQDLFRADDSFVDDLLFWQATAPDGTVVDPVAEQRRLQTVQAQGQPINAGEVPIIERREQAPLEGLFDGLF